MRLCILTHVAHQRSTDGRLLSFGPYVKEINAFAGMFSRLVVVAPRSSAPASAEALAYSHPHVEWISCPNAGGQHLTDKAGLALSVPAMAWAIWKGMSQADAIHVRCPGNLGLLGALLVRCTQKPRFAKYAGEWNDFAGEEWTVRIQKRLLAQPGFHGPVTYYGSSSALQASHLVPFFTSSMTNAEIAAALPYAQQKHLTMPVRVMFTGRLSPNRGVDILLRAIASLNAHNSGKYELIVAGDGSERPALLKLAAELNIADSVTWLGWQPLDKLFVQYQQAHIICMPTRTTESWGKTLQEGMAYGAVPVASRIGGLSAQLAAHPELLAQPGDAESLARTIEQVAASPEQFAVYQRWAIEQAKRWSLDKLASTLHTLLQNAWHVALPTPHSAVGER